MGKLIDADAAINTLNEQIEQCNKALGSFDISLKDEYAIKVERASLKAYKEQLENMPSAQPERKGHGCEYCCEDSDGYVLSIEKNGHAYIQNGKLALRANGWRGECGIDYCPMCGRKLRGEQK